MKLLILSAEAAENADHTYPEPKVMASYIMFDCAQNKKMCSAQ